MIWKEVKRYNAAQSLALVHGMTPDLQEADLGEVKADSVEQLVVATNLKLKLVEANQNKLIQEANKTKGRINEAEQKIIRADLEKEHLRLLGHDLNLENCQKTNTWEIGNYARAELIKNFAKTHPNEVTKNCTSGKDISENAYIKAHNLISRMSINAMAKQVKKNAKNIPTVSLLLTFATEHNKDQFQHIAKDCGIGTKPSIPKQYADQKARVMNDYKAIINVSGPEMWVKVDVRQCRPEEPMQFTVQTKKAGDASSKWKTAGKVVVVAPTMWGRWSDDKKDEYLKGSFEQFSTN